jgi:hypothetical protein
LGGGEVDPYAKKRQIIIIQPFLVMKIFVVGEVASQVGSHKVREQPFAHEEWVLISFGNNLGLMRCGFSIGLGTTSGLWSQVTLPHENPLVQEPPPMSTTMYLWGCGNI